MIGIVVIWTIILLCKKESMQNISLFCYLKKIYLHLQIKEYGRTRKLIASCITSI